MTVRAALSTRSRYLRSGRGDAEDAARVRAPDTFHSGVLDSVLVERPVGRRDGVLDGEGGESGGLGEDHLEAPMVHRRQWR